MFYIFPWYIQPEFLNLLQQIIIATTTINLQEGRFENEPATTTEPKHSPI